MRRIPRIISRTVQEKASSAILHDKNPYSNECEIKGEATETDKLFCIIEQCSEDGYCFADNENGISWIRRDDIEEQGNDVFVIRFRCPTERIGETYFIKMAEKVCKEWNCQLHLLHETRTEFNIPYEECVWVLKKDENLAIEC